MEKKKLYGAFYQVPLEEDLTAHDAITLLNKIVVHDSDKVRFIEVMANHAVAYGYMNITEMEKDLGEDITDFVDLGKRCLNKLQPILNDMNLETTDNIYNMGNKLNVFLGYTHIDIVEDECECKRCKFLDDNLFCPGCPFKHNICDHCSFKDNKCNAFEPKEDK